MRLNYFDPVLRVYTHTAAAMVNPKRKGEFFRQAFATADELPVLNENEVAIRNVEDTEWQVVEDNRGLAWDVETRERINITELGALPEGYTTDQPQLFDEWVGGRWQKNEAAELDAAKDQAKQAVRQYATECRSKLVGGLDQYRMAEYADKAALAPSLVAGTATDDEKQVALTDAWAIESGVTDPAAVGAEWLRKANLFRIARNKVNQMERDALSEIDSRRVVHTVTEKLEEWQAAAESEMDKLLSSI